jgi:exoribonuclease R
VERAARLGYEMDVSSAGVLMKSFQAITDPTARRLLELLSFKATHRAKYFCAGMLDIAKYQHYALNVPLYTHFTSPIRRYADVLVHRQLESILQGGRMYRSFVLWLILLTLRTSGTQVYHGSRRRCQSGPAVQHVGILILCSGGNF